MSERLTTEEIAAAHARVDFARKHGSLMELDMVVMERMATGQIMKVLDGQPTPDTPVHGCWNQQQSVGVQGISAISK